MVRGGEGAGERLSGKGERCGAGQGDKEVGGVVSSGRAGEGAWNEWVEWRRAGRGRGVRRAGARLKVLAGLMERMDVSDVDEARSSIWRRSEPLGSLVTSEVSGDGRRNP